VHPRDAIHPYRRRECDFRENRQEDDIRERWRGGQFTEGNSYFREHRHDSNSREHRQEFNTRGHRQEGGWGRENHRRDWNTSAQNENKPVVDPGDRWQAGSSMKRGDSSAGAKGRVTRDLPRDTTYDYVIPKSYRYFEHDDRDDASRRLNSRGRRGGSFRRDDKAWNHDMFKDEKDPRRVSSDHDNDNDQQDESSSANAKHETGDVDSEDEGIFESKE